MPSGHRPGHRAELHSPSIVASTAPPGQNSIMIWGNKERGLKPGCASLRKGREEETKAAFASPRGKAAPQPHPACGSSPGHIPWALQGPPGVRSHTLPTSQGPCRGWDPPSSPVPDAHPSSSCRISSCRCLHPFPSLPFPPPLGAALPAGRDNCHSCELTWLRGIRHDFPCQTRHGEGSRVFRVVVVVFFFNYFCFPALLSSSLLSSSEQFEGKLCQ